MTINPNFFSTPVNNATRTICGEGNYVDSEKWDEVIAIDGVGCSGHFVGGVLTLVIGHKLINKVSDNLNEKINLGLTQKPKLEIDKPVFPEDTLPSKLPLPCFGRLERQNALYAFVFGVRAEAGCTSRPSNSGIDIDRALDKVNNSISDHLTNMDFEGAKNEMNGIKISRPKGEYFDHIGEIKQARNSLEKQKSLAENELKINERKKHLTQDEIDKLNDIIDKSTDGLDLIRTQLPNLN